MLQMGEREKRRKKKDIHYTRNILYVHAVHVVMEMKRTMML